MISVKNLALTLKKDLRVIIDDFTFAIQDGEKAAIIGEEGNGKSTLLKALYDPKLIAAYAELAGSIAKSDGSKAYLPQNGIPFGRTESVYGFLSRVCALNDRDWPTIQETAMALGLETELLYAEEPMASLSGGEKIKVMLFALLVERPAFLFLDEPTNDLDASSRLALANAIGATTATVVFVSHDEELLESCADCIIHLSLEHKKTQPHADIAHLPYEEFAERRKQSLARQSLLAGEEKRAKETRDTKYRRLYQNVQNQLEATNSHNPEAGRKLKKKMHVLKAMGKRYAKEDESMVQTPHPEEELTLRLSQEVPADSGSRLLEINIPVLTAGDKKLSESIDLVVKAGERIAIVGDNGIGKTTLLNRIWEAARRKAELKPSYMTQDYERMFRPGQTATDFVCDSSPLKEERERARAYLGWTGFLFSEMTALSAGLSGGQKAKAFFAKLAYRDSHLILMDEPTRNISPLQLPPVRHMLKDFKGTLIFVTHDKALVEAAATAVYALTPQGLRPVDPYD